MNPNPPTGPGSSPVPPPNELPATVSGENPRRTGPVASLSLDPKKRIWVVDDDETVLLLADEVLTGAGFEVETFHDPRLALEIIARGYPDLIVLDVMMPELNGFEFCSQLRAQPEGKDVPILMATCLDDLSSITHAYEAGATNFATKPLNWEIETHRLRYMLRVAETSRLLKLREREARVAKEEWERTFNSFSDVVTLLSPDFKICRANLATVKAVKKPLDSILGAHCYKLFAELDQPCIDCPIAHAIQTGAAVSAEKQYRNPAKTCLVTGSPVTDETGTLLHVVHIARDLTEQKMLEMEYLHAQKMEAMGTLAGGIAHDFNNLLMTVSGCAEWIRTDLKVPAEQRELAEMIFEAAQRGALLSGQLLTFSRKGMAKNERTTLQLNGVIRNLHKMLGRVFPKNLLIQLELAEDLHLVRGSADQLNQVLMNLAVNASHAMANGGTLRMETANIQLDAGYRRLHPDVQPGEFVLVVISDTGHGMDWQTQQRIFEPFFTTKKVGEGTGLGLSVAYGIIKDHGGHIVCESKVGEGTAFKIYLPVQTAAAEAAVAEPKANLAKNGGSETILIVDDEAPIRSLLQRSLTKLGYTVISAVDGESALLGFHEAKDLIRLVVMDLGMPGMGGWECLKQLRVSNPQLPIFLATGYGGADLQERAREEGAVRLINKPYQLEELFRNIREVLDGGNETSASNLS